MSGCVSESVSEERESGHALLPLKLIPTQTYHASVGQQGTRVVVARRDVNDAFSRELQHLRSRHISRGSTRRVAAQACKGSHHLRRLSVVLVPQTQQRPEPPAVTRENVVSVRDASYSPTYSTLTHLCTHSLTHSLARSLTHSLTHSLIHSLTHSLIHSHSLTLTPIII